MKNRALCEVANRLITTKIRLKVEDIVSLQCRSLTPKRTASLPKPEMEIGRTNPFFIANSTWLGSYRDLIYGEHDADLANLSDNDNCAIANANRCRAVLGTLSVRGEGKAVVPPVTGPPTLTAGAVP